jgi:NADH dehydrogenase
MSEHNHQKKRIVIIGGGFGGVYTTRHVERLWRESKEVEIALVSRDNYFLMTPLLFEAGSGVLEPRHVVNPIRPLLRKAQFVEAEVSKVDFDRQVVTVCLANEKETDEIPYDHLVIALGGVTNTTLVPGADTALTFKTLGDAIYMRNHVIRLFEWADIEKDARRRKALLTFTIVGGGLVGLELMGELTIFVKNVAKLYKNVDPSEIRFEMIEAAPRIAMEFDDALAEYSADVLRKRGVKIRTGTPVKAIYPNRLELPDGEMIDSHTIVVATGVIPNPLIKTFPISKDQKGRVKTDATMRVEGRDNVWALGDCAAIPDPSGKPYPALAQHALREARQLAENITAVLKGWAAKPFVYETKGTLALLGDFKGAGKIYKLKIHGFIAWWVWRTYYLFQMPHWSRRLRVVIDWTVALFFHNDVVQLDLSRGARPLSPPPPPPTPPPTPSLSSDGPAPADHTTRLSQEVTQG